VSAWAIANPENRCSRVAAGAISNARYYDPELGRFIQPDSVIQDLSNPQSYNRYAYCVNNPLRYNDPTGHDYFYGRSGDGQWGLVNGPYAYMNARSTLGQMGAAFYNTIPLLDNTIYQVSRPVNAVFDTAGNAVHDVVLLTTGDEQLAQNGRALPLLVGGEVGAIGKVESATATVEKVTSLQERANELHGLLDPVAQRRRTTAVTATAEGVTYVSSSEKRLSAAQQAALKPGEVAAVGPGHAEVTGINAAKAAGNTPTATAASRPICPTCAETLNQESVKPASPLKQQQ
jgi:hypothetical protein